MSEYRYLYDIDPDDIHAEAADLKTCDTCGCEAPLLEFEISDIPTAWKLKQEGEPTTHLLCEVCSMTGVGRVIGGSSSSQRALEPQARLMAQVANLLLDKLSDRRKELDA